jgi:vancomycin permeability regulator SanA
VFIYILGKEHTFNSRNIDVGKNNIGVVLGAAVWSNNKPSPSLSSRVDKAIELYEQGKISKIYLTGSNAPGELAESEVALNYIKSLGRDIPDIEIEKQTTSTNEQVDFIKKKLLQKYKNHIAVISDSYHIVRVLEIGKFQNIKLKAIPSDLVFGLETSVYNRIRESLALTVFWFFAI